jgi:hypothetical protein
MKREEGFYWVKIFSDTEWVIAEFTGGFWIMNFNDSWERLDDNSLFQINETRILNPGESGLLDIAVLQNDNYTKEETHLSEFDKALKKCLNTKPIKYKK